MLILEHRMLELNGSLVLTQLPLLMVQIWACERKINLPKDLLIRAVGKLGCSNPVCSDVFVLTLLLFSHAAVSNSLWSHGLQDARPPCPSPSLKFMFIASEFAQVHVHCIGDAIQPCLPLMPFSPSALHLSQHQGLFPMSGLCASDNQTTGASASASLLPLNIQGWPPLRLTGLISWLSKGFSGVFSKTTVQRHQLFGILLSVWSSSHNPMWPLGRP